MAAKKIESPKLESNRTRWQFGIRALFIGTVVVAFAVLIAKDIDYSIFKEKSSKLPVFPTIRSDNASKKLSHSDLLPAEIEKSIKQSILERIQNEEEKAEKND